jgi:hypothetical protein
VFGFPIWSFRVLDSRQIAASAAETHHEDEIQKSMSRSPERHLLERRVWERNCGWPARTVLRSGAVKTGELQHVGNLGRGIAQGLHLDRPRHAGVSEGGPQRVHLVKGQLREEEMRVNKESVIALPVIGFNAPEGKAC